MADAAKWYVIHTYSGYENKVKTNIEKTVENRGIQDLIQEIRIPMEEVVEVKDKEDGTQDVKLYSARCFPAML